MVDVLVVVLTPLPEANLWWKPNPPKLFFMWLLRTSTMATPLKFRTADSDAAQSAMAKEGISRFLAKTVRGKELIRGWLNLCLGCTSSHRFIVTIALGKAIPSTGRTFVEDAEAQKRLRQKRPYKLLLKKGLLIIMKSHCMDKVIRR